MVTFVQSGYAASNSIIINSTTAGSLLLVLLNTDAATVSFSDSKTNAYSLIAQNGTLYLFACLSNTSSGNDTLTASLTGQTFVRLLVVEFTGQATNPFDVIGPSTSSVFTSPGPNAILGPIANNFTNDLIVAINSVIPAGFTPGAGYFSTSNSGDILVFEYGSLAARPGMYQAPETLTGGGTAVGWLLALKSSSSVQTVGLKSWVQSHRDFINKRGL